MFVKSSILKLLLGRCDGVCTATDNFAYRLEISQETAKL
jgi:hypothetical protein